MLLVDSRIGSEDLCVPLAAMGLPAELTHLEFADVAFEGKGPGGRPRWVGIELKKLGDLVGSLRSGRLSGHQLPGLVAQYDFSWLLVEGQWKTSSTGHLTVYRGKQRGWSPLPGNMTVAEMEKQVLTLELCGGLHTRYTNSRNDTLHFIANLYRWFTDKAMDKHHSHMASHTPNSFIKVSKFRDAVRKYPGIDLKWSLAVEQYFRASLRRATNASAEEWAGIEVVGDKGTRRLGLSVGRQIEAFCTGGK